jgi:aryl-alcohol dehydrogenase-like predicted oxidoreductase
METSRRSFLHATAGMASTIAFAGTAFGAGESGFPNASTEATPPQSADPVPAFTTPATTTEGQMQYRILGKTGEKVSIVGLGGFHLGKIKSEQDAIKICRRAIDSGVTFMDNSWDYNAGRSETIMGKALQDGYRKKVFLMTKLDGRTKDSAGKQLDESLKRLQTDVIDLCQIHEVIRLEDPDRCFASPPTSGAIEAYIEARKAGKIRYIGFTGHKDPLVHLRMIEVAKAHGFHFDVLQMPLNVMDAHFRSFAHHVLPVAMKEEIAVVNMKPLGGGFIVKTGLVTAVECLHYAMNLPTCVCITGCESEKDLDQALEAAKTFKPMQKDEVAALLAKTREAAMTGQYEGFKTTDRFDSTAHNPDWLGPKTEGA